MPRFTIKKAIKPAVHDDLVQRLVQELKSPATKPQPLILEEEVDSTGSLHVHVIWDQWGNLSEDQRSAIIVEAYERAEGEAAAESLALASGLTPKEAYLLGFLPYRVVIARKRHENRPTMTDHKKAMKAESARTVLGTDADDLCYARLEDAEGAVQRLERALPGSAWSIQKDD